jgi:hypothetical protein
MLAGAETLDLADPTAQDTVEQRRSEPLIDKKVSRQNVTHETDAFPRKSQEQKSWRAGRI